MTKARRRVTRENVGSRCFYKLRTWSHVHVSEAACRTDRLHLMFINQPHSGGGGDAGGVTGGKAVDPPAADPSTCVSVTIMWSDGGFIPSPASLWWLKHDVVIELTCLCLIQPEQQINVDDEPAASLSQWPLIQSLLYTRASCERLLLYCFTTLLPSKSHL